MIFFDAVQCIGTPLTVSSFPSLPIHTYQVRGTQASPVRDVSVTGVQFSDASASFMKPHGVPSSGDWGLRRNAAVVLEGIVNVSFASCQFVGLDGNGMLLTGCDWVVVCCMTIDSTCLNLRFCFFQLSSQFLSLCERSNPVQFCLFCSLAFSITRSLDFLLTHSLTRSLSHSHP
jgi:hypothetical protein